MTLKSSHFAQNADRQRETLKYDCTLVNLSFLFPFYTNVVFPWLVPVL